MAPQDIALDQWIDFTNSCAPLDTQMETVNALPEGRRKQVLLQNNYVARAYKWAEFFGLRTELVDDVLQAYETFMQDIGQGTPVTLPALDDIKAGQFLDSKMIIGGTGLKSRWEQLKYIIVIFAGERYNPRDCNESSRVFKAAGQMTVDKCVYVLNWFDRLNEEIRQRYTLFHDSEQSDQPHMSVHMQRWGWVNFLKTIARTKVFDIAGSGMNSIDCVRASALDDVLTWASEERDYSIAQYNDSLNG